MPDFKTVRAAGTSVPIVSATVLNTTVAIPVAADGNRPKLARIAATRDCYVRFGLAGITATMGDLLVQPADAAVVSVVGCTHIGVYAPAGAAGNISIVPLEDQG